MSSTDKLLMILLTQAICAIGGYLIGVNFERDHHRQVAIESGIAEWRIVDQQTGRVEFVYTYQP